MSTIEIRSSQGSYQIQIGIQAIEYAGEIDFLIVDQNVPEDKLPAAKSIHLINASESLKTLSTIEEIVSSMAAAGLTRGSVVHALGGGIVQDLATLSCSIYMRGINWVYWPSTFTGMLDSCIGGKSSINVADHKNLIGNFHPPIEILIDTSLLASLPEEHLISGLAEGVKICFAKSQSALSDFLEISNLTSGNLIDKPEALIELALNAKKWFVEIDEFDKRERQLLNFGHSFGHALESASNYLIPHGIAIALGMKAALRFDGTPLAQPMVTLDAYCDRLLRNWRDFRSKTERIDWDVFAASLERDKKNSKADLRLVLPNKEGRLLLKSIPFSSGATQKATETIRRVVEDLTNEVL